MTRRGPVLALAIVLAACAVGGAPDSALEQKVTWFHYVAGEDLRADCRTDGPTTFRFVYNALFNKDVRALDLTAGEGGGTLESRRYQGARVLNVQSAGLVNRPDQASVALDGTQVAALLDAIVADGFAGPAESGLILRSDTYHAVATGCRGGEFRIHGYTWDRLGNLATADALRALDPLGVPWPEPVDSDAPSSAHELAPTGTHEDSDPYFVLELGQFGLRGFNEW